MPFLGARPAHEGNPVELDERMAELGRELGSREATHAENLDAAWEKARALHARVETALSHFHAAAADAGSSHLRIELGEPKLDAKHVRAVEFDFRRGRIRAIVVAKSRGDVTLVGPFAMGKAEGPCCSVDFGAEAELEEALEDLMVRFLDAAVVP